MVCKLLLYKFGRPYTGINSVLITEEHREHKKNFWGGDYTEVYGNIYLLINVARNKIIMVVVEEYQMK